MAPSNVNNAARELMGHMRDMYEQLGDGYFEFGDGDGTYTVARGDADTITITSSADISGIYFAGRKIRITDGGANVVEGTIASSSHSSTTQTVNLTGISLASGTPTKVELGIDTAAFGGRIILDDDGDTYIEAPTDDTIDIYVAGAKDFVITANTFTAESGSTIAAQALTATTVTASGEIDGGSLDISGDADIDGTTNLDVVDIDGAVDMASTLQVDGAITSSAGATITTADNTDTLSLISTDADANVGPNLRLYRNSSSPADNDTLGQLAFVGRNDNSQDFNAFQMTAYSSDVSDGTEDGTMQMYTMQNGSLHLAMQITPTETVFNDSSKDQDFRVESNGNTHMLFVDGGNDKVGIGTSSLTGTFHVKSTDAGTTMYIEDSHAGDGDGPELYLYRNSASPADNDSIGIVKFLGRNDNSQDVIYGQMQSIILDASDGTEDAKTVFNNMIGGSSLNMLQFDNTGVVINESSNDLDFRVESNGNTHALFVDGGTDNVSIGTSAEVEDFGSDKTHLTIRSASSGNYAVLELSGHTDNNDQIHGLINFYNETTSVARIQSIQQSNTSDANLNFFTAPSSGGIAERMRIHSGGDISIGRTTVDTTNVGISLEAGGTGVFVRSGGPCVIANRLADDGEIIRLVQAGTTEGTISVSGSTISYNAFTGSHWSRLADNSKPSILVGTIMESLDSMINWYQAVANVAEVKYTAEDQAVIDGDKNVGDVKTEAHTIKEEIALPDGKSVGDAVTFTHYGTEYTGVYAKENDVKHVHSKVSDSADSTRVYGVFHCWGNDNVADVNDMEIAQVGTYIIRVHKDVTVSAGDLLVSNGDGTAKKQDDDIIRSKTVAKVNSNVKVETYADGSYTVPCTLHC
jgi:hypothetical protein